MKAKLLCLFMLFCVPVTGIFAANDCNELIKQAAGVVLNKPTDQIVVNTDNTWQKIDWIKQQFGKGTENTIIKKTYFWKKFGLVTINDMTITTIGVTPDALEKATPNDVNPTSKDAIKVLGEPTKVDSHVFIRYSWICPNTNSNIIINTDESGKILSMAGMSCELLDNADSSTDRCVGFTTAGN